jgi:ribosomal protein S3
VKLDLRISEHANYVNSQFKPRLAERRSYVRVIVSVRSLVSGIAEGAKVSCSGKLKAPGSER